MSWRNVVLVFMLSLYLIEVGLSQENNSSAAEAWRYDSTAALLLAFVWWLAELCSLRSQRILHWTAVFNVIWSLLSIVLLVAVVGTFIGEQVLRENYSVSLPTTIATVIAASLSYLLVQDRLSFFDCRARILQRLIRSDKLRFGRPGTLGSEKWCIQWHWWMKGDPVNSWHEEEAMSATRNVQILLDWGLEHRLGGLTVDDVMKSVRGDRDLFWSTIGKILYAWIPTGSHIHLHPEKFWSDRGKMKGSYKGSRGRRFGCEPDVVNFIDWLKRPQVQHFQLAAIEYRHATKALIVKLSEIAMASESTEELARLFMEEWTRQITQ